MTTKIEYPSRSLGTLRAQHQHLRHLLDEVVQRAGAPFPPDMTSLIDLVGQLAEELKAHNLSEEVLLEPLLRPSTRGRRIGWPSCSNTIVQSTR